MSSSPSEWNARHRAAAEDAHAEPSTIVSELLPLLPQGIALDLACGLGRHTLLLAARQQRVVALDSSSVALSDLENRARSGRIEVQRSANLEIPATVAKHDIHLVEADLEHAILPKDSFSLILCIHYLQRSLFPQIASALRPGGPKNPAYLLDEGELRSAFPSLHPIFYRELRAGRGIASLLGQRPHS